MHAEGAQFLRKEKKSKGVILFLKYYKYEFWYTDIPINVIFGQIGILVYKIHTYNIFKKV